MIIKIFWVIFIGFVLTMVTASENIAKYFKNQADSLNYDNVTPPLKIVFNDMKEYCEKNGMEFLITSFLSTLIEDQSIAREYAGHREGRAFDLRVSNWSQVQSDAFINYYCNVSPLRTLGAFSAKSGIQVLVVRHNSGAGDHVHVQVHF